MPDDAPNPERRWPKMTAPEMEHVVRETERSIPTLQMEDAPLTEEQKERQLRYFRNVLIEEERRNSQVIPLPEDDPTGELLTARWSTLSDTEKDIQLKKWNEDFNKRHPYIPPPHKETPWLKLIAKFIAVWVALTAGLIWLRREIHPFTLYFAIFTGGLLIWYLCSRANDADKEIEALKRELAEIKGSLSKRA